VTSLVGGILFRCLRFLKPFSKTLTRASLAFQRFQSGKPEKHHSFLSALTYMLIVDPHSFLRQKHQQTNADILKLSLTRSTADIYLFHVMLASELPSRLMNISFTCFSCKYDELLASSVQLFIILAGTLFRPYFRSCLESEGVIVPSSWFPHPGCSRFQA
jgi:hypothetical protein